MKDKECVELFTKDAKYYDKERRELTAVLSFIDISPAKRLIDIGTGNGRLAIPLSRHLNVTAIDTNKTLVDLINEKSIQTINGKIEELYPADKYDYGLIVWPGFSNYRQILNHIREHILKDDGKLIIIKSREHDLKTIAMKLYPELFGKEQGFLEVLPEYFNIEKEKRVTTEWIYPNPEEALKMLKFKMEAFYGKAIQGSLEKEVKDFVKTHEDSGKVYLHASIKVLLCN